MKRLNRSTRSSLFTYLLVIAAFAVVQVLRTGGGISSTLEGQLVPICAYVVMALSLNLTVGILGELSLGHAGFMSVGAFSGVVASIALTGAIPFAPVRLAVSMVIGALCAGVVGVVVGVPVLRLNGDYLAIVTLAFGEIIKNLLNSIYLGYDDAGFHFSMKDTMSLNLAEGGKVLIKGAQGIVGTPKNATFFWGFLLVMLTLFIVLNLIKSRTGRAIMSIRDNRIAAESIGINVTKYKLIAFAISAALAGAAGALYAHNFSSLVASKFDYNTSILILVFVVLGGMGNIRGSIIAATILTVLPEMLRSFSDYRMLIYAIVLICVMIFTQSPKLVNWRKRMFAKMPQKKRDEKKGGA